MVCYPFLPALILVLYPIRTHRWRCVTLFIAGVVARYLFQVRAVMQMSGGSPFFSPFLFGMAAVHLRHRLTTRVAHVLLYSSLAAIVVFSSNFS